jgi:hypothetical protein
LSIVAMSDFSTFSQMTGMRSLYFWRCETMVSLMVWRGLVGMEGGTHDAFGFSLALLEGVLVLEFGSHGD